MCSNNLRNRTENLQGKHTSSNMSCAPPPLPHHGRRRGLDVLALPRHLRVPGVILLHVPAASAAGGVGLGFDGGGGEVLGVGGGVDGGADVAGAAAAVGGLLPGWLGNVEKAIGHCKNGEGMCCWLWGD